MRVTASISSMKVHIEREIDRGARAVRGGIADATIGLKSDLRRQIVSAGLGARLANTWRSRVKPDGPSLDADGWVWSKAPDIIRSFSTGVIIRAKHGHFLAVALQAAGKGPRGRRITPAMWERRTGRKLIYVPARSGRRNPLLVTDAATGRFGKTGRAGISRKRSGRATVAIFVLLRQVKPKRLLSPEAAANKATREIPRKIEARWRGAR